jgi:hypothetical protein
VVDVNRSESVDQQALQADDAPLHGEYRTRSSEKGEAKQPARRNKGSTREVRITAAPPLPDRPATHEADGTEKRAND